MIDPVKVVSDRILARVEAMYPEEGPAKFDNYWSTLKVQEYQDLKYGASNPATVTASVLQTAEFSNGSSVADKQTFTVNKTTMDTFSFSLKETISVKISGKAKIPFLADGGAEVTTSFESTQVWTKTETRSWTYSSEVNVPAHKRVKTSFVVSEGNYEIPFTARIPVRGKVWIKFPRTWNWFGQEIDDLIKANWDDRLFECVMEGTFKGVHGMQYQVKVEEFDLPSEANALHSAHVPLSERTIDTGVMIGGKLQSNFALMGLTKKGPDQIALID